MDTAFFKLTPEIVLKVSRLKLNQSEMKLWMYLSSLDPFGDRKMVLPPSHNLAKRLRMSIASFFRAKAKLQQLGLFSFYDKYTEFTNNLGSHSRSLQALEPSSSDSSSKTVPISGYSHPCDTNSHSCDADSQICEVVSQFCDTTTHSCDTDSHCCENQPLKPLPDKDSSFSQTIQTIQTLSYSPNSETSLKERENIDVCLKECCSESGKVNIETPKTTSIHTQVISQDHRANIAVSTPHTPKDTFTPVRGTVEDNESHKGLVGMSEVLSPNTRGQSSRVQMKAWEWLPDGEWKVDGKLDPRFHDWLANKWMAQYNKTDLFMAKADVLAHFQKSPERLPIRYLQWLEENNARQQRQIQLSNNEQSSPNIPTSSNLPSTSTTSDNSVICSDGQRTVKSKDYTGISKLEPEIPVNPHVKHMIDNFLDYMTGRKQKQQPPQYNNNQTQGLSPI